MQSDDYELLERAAIKEFDGKMSRYEAERQARAEEQQRKWKESKQ